jgi:hypothetical protein
MVRRRVSAVSNHEGPVGESIPSTTERYDCGANKSTTADIGIPRCSFAGFILRDAAKTPLLRIRR